MWQSGWQAASRRMLVFFVASFRRGRLATPSIDVNFKCSTRLCIRIPNVNASSCSFTLMKCHILFLFAVVIVVVAVVVVVAEAISYPQHFAKTIFDNFSMFLPPSRMSRFTFRFR